MVLSSRDRRFGQRRDSLVKTIRESAAACVSLSNSTMSKTPIGSRRPHCFAPVVGGGGYLVAGLFGVNRSFRTFSHRPDHSGIWRKNHCGPPRGFPHKSLAIRLKVRNLTKTPEKIKRLFQTTPPSQALLKAPKKSGVSSRRPPSCQPRREAFRTRPETSEPIRTAIPGLR